MFENVGATSLIKERSTATCPFAFMPQCSTISYICLIQRFAVAILKNMNIALPDPVHNRLTWHSISPHRLAFVVKAWSRLGRFTNRDGAATQVLELLARDGWYFAFWHCDFSVELDCPYCTTFNQRFQYLDGKPQSPGRLG